MMSLGKGWENHMYKVGVVGDKDSILGFKALGMSVFPVTSALEAQETVEKIASMQYAVNMKCWRKICLQFRCKRASLGLHSGTTGAKWIFRQKSGDTQVKNGQAIRRIAPSPGAWFGNPCMQGKAAFSGCLSVWKTVQPRKTCYRQSWVAGRCHDVAYALIMKKLMRTLSCLTRS